MLACETTVVKIRRGTLGHMLSYCGDSVTPFGRVEVPLVEKPHEAVFRIHEKLDSLWRKLRPLTSLSPAGPNWGGIRGRLVQSKAEQRGVRWPKITGSDNERRGSLLLAAIHATSEVDICMR